MDIMPEAGIVLGSIDDFPQIYEDMKRQFPQDEMYEYRDFLRMFNQGRYKPLLYRRTADSELLGYALIYVPESGNVVWMDYLAVMQPYQSHGYGQKLFQAVWQKYCGPFDGVIFSVEHVAGDDPHLAQRQMRRIGFYEKLGAKRLRAAFLQPCDGGSFPMYLYFKPKNGHICFSRAAQIESITQMYSYCCSQFKSSRELLLRFKETIADERFTD